MGEAIGCAMPQENMTCLAARLDAVRSRVTAACVAAGRTPDTVTLIAVSKTYPLAAVTEAWIAGQQHFGENRVQEADVKFLATRTTMPGLLLHLIGPLQTNKARDAVRRADVIETVDRPRLADALEDAVAREGRSPDFLIQVNVGREPQKAGIAPEHADGFIAACQRRFGDRLRGLMCVPPISQDPVPHFRALATLATNHGLQTLSMGMSADFEAAIRYGATQVRIGSAIFGSRLQAVPQADHDA